DHLYVDLAGAQRGRDLEPDEARADHHRLLASFGFGDDGTAVLERAQRLRLAAARQRQAYRFGARRKYESVERDRVATFERDAASVGIEGSNRLADAELDAVLAVV